MRNLFLAHEKLEALLKHRSMSATAFGVNKHNHRHLRRNRILAAIFFGRDSDEVMASGQTAVAGGGVLQANGITHGEADVGGHEQLLLQVLLVYPNPR